MKKKNILRKRSTFTLLLEKYVFESVQFHVILIVISNKFLLFDKNLLIFHECKL